MCWSRDSGAGVRVPAGRHRDRRRLGPRRLRAARFVSTGTVIRTRALTKRYGELRAVDGIDLEVAEGDVYGFLGANGSGKTTTMRMLLGLVLPTSGEAEVLDQPMPGARRTVLPQVGVLVEGPGAYPHLSGSDNLAILDASGRDRSPRHVRRPRIAEVLDEVGLDPADRRPTRTYSLGMHQRLGLAAALMRRPRLLVLDEPTNGLDPQGIDEIRRLLLRLERRRNHHLPVQPSAVGDRADVHPGGRAGPRAVGAPGAAGRAARCHGTGHRADARHRALSIPARPDGARAGKAIGCLSGRRIRRRSTPFWSGRGYG